MREGNRSSRKRVLSVSEYSNTLSTHPGESGKGQLCDACSKLDFDRILLKTRASKGNAGGFLFNVEKVTEHTRCPLCILFHHMRLPARKLRVYRPGEDVEYCVRAFSATHLRLLNYPRAEDEQDTIMLGVVPRRIGDEKFIRKIQPGWNTMDETGYIYPVIPNLKEDSERFSGRAVNPVRVDFDLLRSWLAFCSDHHSKFCSHLGAGRQRRRAGNHGEFTLNVIDCSYTREIIVAPKESRYATLSYVCMLFSSDVIYLMSRFTILSFIVSSLLNHRC